MSKYEDSSPPPSPFCSWRWRPSCCGGGVRAGRHAAGERRRPGRCSPSPATARRRRSPWPSCRRCPCTSGYSGIINSAGTVTPPGPVKGVKLTDLLAEVGGIPELQSADVTAIDDYGMTFTYDEAVNGNVTMYDADTQGGGGGRGAGLHGAPLRRERCADRARTGRGRSAASRRLPARPTSAKWRPATCSSSGSTASACAAPSCRWTVKMYGLKNKRGKRQTYTLDRAHLRFVRHPRAATAPAGSSPPRRRRGRASRSSSASARSTAARATGATAPTTRRWRSRATGSRSPRSAGKSVIIGSRIIRNQDKIILANKLQGSELAADVLPAAAGRPEDRQQGLHRADRQDPAAAEMTGAATTRGGGA